MPMYIFLCVACSNEEEHLADIKDRDKVKLECSKCGSRLKRVPAAANFDVNPYHMKAVLNNGQHVAGHFGKSAPLLRKK